MRLTAATQALYALGFALLALQLGALVLAGPPVTHDGFWHLGWVEALNHAVHHEGVYPRWYAEAYGGAGSPSFIYYPPGFRLLSLPFGLLSDVASVQLRGAVALVLLIHAAGAWAFVHAAVAAPAARALLWIAALLNPYFLANVWVRGAWPEALAMALLWLLALALWWMLQGRLRRGAILSGLAFAGVLLTHHPSALLWLYAALPLALGLLAWREFRALGALAAAFLVACALAAFHLLPAILDQSAIRLATGDGILGHQWPQWRADASHIARALAAIWSWLVLVAVFGGIAMLGAGRRARWLVLQAGVLVVAIAMMLPWAAPLYAWLPQLGRIQLPWRWLCVATPAALCVLGAAAHMSPRLRASALLLGVVGVASAWPVLREVRFAPHETRVLDAIYRCERAQADCSRFEAPPRLRQQFRELRFLGQLPNHYGPWVDASGRIWRPDIYDYLPRGLLVETFERAPNGIFMPPFTARPDWSFEPRDAARVLGERREGQRRVLDVAFGQPVQVTLARLRYPGWELRARSLDGAYVVLTPDPESLFYRVVLPAGTHRIQLRQVGTRAERAGEALSLAALLGLLVAAWRAAPRESRWRILTRRPEGRHR